MHGKSKPEKWMIDADGGILQTVSRRTAEKHWQFMTNIIRASFSLTILLLLFSACENEQLGLGPLIGLL